MTHAARCFRLARSSSSFSFPFGLSLLAVVLAVLLFPSATGAQVSYTGTATTRNFGSQAVGSASAATALTFSVAAGTTVGSIAVVTTGIETLDFTNAGGGTCAAKDYTTPATCTVEVKFKPEFAGPRKGAVVFFSEAKNTGTILGQVLIYGIGTGPQIGYTPASANVFSLGCCGGRLYVSNARAMTVDAAGNQFIASGDGNYVVEFPAVGGASAAIGISPVVNGEGLNSPSGVAVDGAGDLFIADSGNNRVVEVAPGGSVATSIDPIVDGEGLSFPWGMAVNGAGDLFIADKNNSRVVKLPAGGGAPIAISPVANGEGLSASGSGVIDVALNSAGDLFILDSGNNRVVEVPAGGGTPLAIAPTVNGAGLDWAQGIAVDVAGNLFISNVNSNLLIEVPADGGPAIGLDPTAGGESLWRPVGIAVDGPGNLYIVDNSHTRVVELQRSLTPTVNFPTATGVDTTDTTDGTQTVQVQNLGNDALTLTGLNYPADFPEESGDANACTGSTSLSAGQVCDLPVGFAPTEGGPLSEQITLTDNALNVTGTQQAIAVSGTGYAEVEGATHFSVTSTSPASVFAGTPFTIVVTALNLAGRTATTYSGTVSFASSDSEFVNPGPLTLSSGTGQATVTLPTVGTQTITATDTTSASVTGSASFDVLPVPNVSFIGTAASEKFGSQAVGSASAAQTLTFSILAGTTIGRVGVVTQGAPNLDFANAAGTTCAAQEYVTAATCTVNVTFTPKYAGPRYGAVSFYDASGDVLATTYISGNGVGPQATFANSASGVYLPSIQSTIGSGFDGMAGVAVDCSGNVFVGDWSDGAVKEIMAVGGYTTVKVLANGFNFPFQVAVDGSGNVFVADAGNNAVKEILAAGGYTTINTLGHGFSDPVGVAVDGSGNVFVADNGNIAVKEIVAASGYVTVNTLAIGFANTGGDPEGAAVDGSGNVFVADFGNNSVKEIVAAGGYTIIKTIGSGFSDPSGVAVDGSGNVFVADGANNAVKEIVASGGYSKVIAMGSGFSFPIGLALDGSGNVFVGDFNNHRVEKLDFADPPSLSFAPTTNGSISSDSPQTITVFNNGNAPLTFPVSNSGNNPMISANFVLNSDGDSVCPLVTSGAPAPGTLAADASCLLPISFEPVGAPTGPVTGALSLTDNSLYATSPGYATQSIPLGGSVALPAPPSMRTPAPRSTLTGSTITFTWNPGYGSSAFLLKVGTIGTGSSDIYNGASTTATSATVSNIPVHARPLYVQLSYEMNSTWNSINYQYVEGDGPPFGALGPAVDSITESTIVGQTDSVKITGWAADWLDGAPLSNVSVSIDGTPVGTPVLGLSRPSVAASYQNPAYVNSGYQLLYSASALSLGAHKVTVVATDSGGRSTTFGPVSFTVAASAGTGAPFGGVSLVGDSVTGSKTVGQSDSLEVLGWVADPTDGAPLSNVTALIDGVSVGTPTLGLARPEVVTLYSNPAYLHSGYQLLYSAASLAVGAHKLSVVAVDSGGRSTTFGAYAFTVADTAGLGPPFGALQLVGDSVSGSRTISATGTLEVSGWVADQTDGAPLSNVTVYIDGASVGAPTLGLARPDVAARYHKAAWLNSGFELLYPVASLSAGVHSVLVIAVDSGGRSTTLEGPSFTVQ